MHLYMLSFFLYFKQPKCLKKGELPVCVVMVGKHNNTSLKSFFFIRFILKFQIEKKNCKALNGSRSNNKK